MYDSNMRWPRLASLKATFCPVLVVMYVYLKTEGYTPHVR